jgi:hypothetical protein
MIDFSSLNEQEHADKGAVLKTVMAPDGKTVLEGVTVTCLGANSTIGRNLISKVRSHTIQSLSKRTLDDSYEEATDKLVALTTSWTITMNGQEYKCSSKNKRDLYENPGYEWFRIQVLNFIDGSENFFELKSES